MACGNKVFCDGSRTISSSAAEIAGNPNLQGEEGEDREGDCIEKGAGGAEGEPGTSIEQ